MILLVSLGEDVELTGNVPTVVVSNYTRSSDHNTNEKIEPNKKVWDVRSHPVVSLITAFYPRPLIAKSVVILEAS